MRRAGVLHGYALLTVAIGRVHALAHRGIRATSEGDEAEGKEGN